ncbi:glycoside hydrolase family 2 protein [Nonomuraea soli]
MSSLRPLHHGWTLHQVEGDLSAPATIPGCVHTDLLAAGLIPDPYLDTHELGLTWIGRSAWRYETTLTWEPSGHERADLLFEGLDTVAEIELNGAPVGNTANMHRSYRFDVRGTLRPGRNTLTVTFASPYAYAERLRAELGQRPGAYAEPYNMIRKMACNFGWDWGPTLVTAGIWRPVGLHEWSGARLSRVRPVVRVRDGVARVSVHVELERTHDEPVEVAAELCGLRVVGAISREGVLELEVPDPALWWPRGHGRQPLHELTVTAGQDVWRRRIGFRTAELDTADGAFTLKVNGRPVFAKGVNWIPDDCFPSRVGRDRYAERLEQACQAGVNLIRVWGGGIYESDDFYELCDELGLLVWQDFPFACAAYPEEEPLWSEVAAEAEENVVRLMPHPSLVLWCGNNENIWGYADWQWKPALNGRSWGERYYLGLLPEIVGNMDPSRPYWPGSPYSGSMELHPNLPEVNNMHIWDVWNERDYVHYRDYRPRFVAEFGWQAPATHATIARAIHDEPLTPDSPGLRHHQKADDGNGKLARGLAHHFDEPDGYDDWLYLTQLNQARAIQLGVEHFRSLWPYCAGSVVWQLNDCWPVTSWSAVDGDGRRKPLFHALRRAHADRLLTVQPRAEGLALVAVNDDDEPWRAEALAVRLSVSGGELAREHLELEVPPRGALTLPLDRELAESGDPARELIAVSAGSTRALWFYLPDKDLDLPKAAYAARLEGRTLHVTAHTLLRDLAVFPDRLDPAAEADDQLITLLPGESVSFDLGVSGLDPLKVTGRPVLRCVND